MGKQIFKMVTVGLDTLDFPLAKDLGGGEKMSGCFQCLPFAEEDLQFLQFSCYMLIFSHLAPKNCKALAVQHFRRAVALGMVEK